VGSDSCKTCQYEDDVLKIQLFTNTFIVPAGNGDFPVGVPSTITIDTGASNPSISGDYYIDINSYDTSLTLIESGSILVNFLPTDFSSLVIQPIHTAVDYPTVLRF